MARRDQRAAHQGAGSNAYPTAPPLTPEQQTQLDALLADLPVLAARLRAAQPGGREAIAGALAPVAALAEPLALALAARLGTLRGAEAPAAADAATALGELEPRKEVAREARRSRLRLRSAGFVPELAVPPIPVASALPERAPIAGALAAVPASRIVRLAEAYLTRSRESGEVSLVLAWRETYGGELVRGTLLLLDFHEQGVKDFTVTEPMNRRRFMQQTVERMRSTSGVVTVSLTWAQARHLVEEALDVNEWRGVAPHADFVAGRALLDDRLLGEPRDDEERTAIAEEQARVAREGDRPFIGSDLSPDETAANWVGAWSFGDYGLAYDLLADDAALHRAHSRADYIALRRQWAREAKPGALRLTLVREQTQRASALWLPGAAGGLASGGRDIEVFWSLALEDSPLGGQLDELPMGTLISPISGRHWYWTAYTLRREPAHGLWVIARPRDEGATSQGLTIEELQRRTTEARATAEGIARDAPQNPKQEEAIELARQVTGAISTALAYDDALMAKLPLDASLYQAALDDARTLELHERAEAVIERMLARLGDTPRLRFDQAMEQYLTAESYGQQGQPLAATDWLDRALATLAAVVEAERTPHHLQALAELLARRGRLDEAEARLREAIALAPTTASVHADLASVLMGAVSGESLEREAPTDHAERERMMRTALEELREAARLDPALPALYRRMGGVYDALGLHDDARLAYEQALQQDPADSGTLYALGTLLLMRNDAQQALTRLERAVELEPLAIPYRLSLAGAFIALERRRDAERELDLLDRLQPGLPQVAELRGMLTRKQ